MSRALTTASMAAINAAETAEVFITLLAINHASLPTPKRLCNDATDITHNGNVYSAFPFQISYPTERTDEVPQVQLVLDNIDQSLISTFRTISTEATVDVTIVLASAPNTIVDGPLTFTIKAIAYDAMTITATLMFQPLLNEPFPGDTFTPQNHPGLFAK